MKISKYKVACFTFIIAFPGIAGSSTENLENGRTLFEKYGCTNCHGQDGIHPTSKYVPILKGKSAAYIYENANAIFGGDRSDRKVHAMHDQFCIGEEPEEGCYSVPTSKDLKTIAAWLGSSTLSKNKRTPLDLYVTSDEAYKMIKELGDHALFVDVRTRAEVTFLGMPTDAHANIPYMTVGSFDEWDEKKKTFKLQANSKFVQRIKQLIESRGLKKDNPIFLICRSGSRSAKAARILNLVGYTNVYTVTDGFEGDKAKHGPRKGERVVNGWKNSGLPWSYKLSRDEMYW